MVTQWNLCYVLRDKIFQTCWCWAELMYGCYSADDVLCYMTVPLDAERNLALLLGASVMILQWELCCVAWQGPSPSPTDCCAQANNSSLVLRFGATVGITFSLLFCTLSVCPDILAMMMDDSPVVSCMADQTVLWIFCTRYVFLSISC